MLVDATLQKSTVDARLWVLASGAFISILSTFEILSGQQHPRLSAFRKTTLLVRSIHYIPSPVNLLAVNQLNFVKCPTQLQDSHILYIWTTEGRRVHEHSPG